MQGLVREPDDGVAVVNLIGWFHRHARNVYNDPGQLSQIISAFLRMRKAYASLITPTSVTGPGSGPNGPHGPGPAAPGPQGGAAGPAALGATPPKIKVKRTAQTEGKTGEAKKKRVKRPNLWDNLSVANIHDLFQKCGVVVDPSKSAQQQLWHHIKAHKAHAFKGAQWDTLCGYLRIRSRALKN
jgi:hypothetical protein